VSMYSHIVLGANDIAAAKAFYDAVLGALGYPEGNLMGDRIIYSNDAGILMITKPYDGNEATFGNGVTIGFNAASSDVIDAFHAAGMANGGSDEGAPGPRPAIPGSYGAYLRDPTGNKLLAWCVQAA